MRRKVVASYSDAVSEIKSDLDDFFEIVAGSDLDQIRFDEACRFQGAIPVLVSHTQRLLDPI
jgi:hypothetical protein